MYFLTNEVSNQDIKKLPLHKAAEHSMKSLSNWEDKSVTV